ncbi:lysozyme inhibitor LprI family protein [Microcoleus sp. FACHB-672]|uniref:lysozyme inhibitor LprI family protein n=1 Tax=Microcoleus sp. FACHB-672 TaxID=2692825 RepID=UPI001686C30E|nr:lysozyme inhibitor LprI family protein [Microcoleus sp. FACHB-672]MBD2042799.1 DUF1311 domain-containing protein [Microcoleus sp. FACHB-672]
MLKNISKLDSRRIAVLTKQIISVILIAIVLLSVLSTPSLAAPENIDCSKPTSEVELKYCAGLSYEAADKRLNEIYQQVILTLSPDKKNQLTEIQQTWIKLRDGSCNFETYLYRTSTGYGTALLQCLERLTRRRTASLEEYLSFRGGTNLPKTLNLLTKGENIKKQQNLLNEPKES